MHCSVVSGWSFLVLFMLISTCCSRSYSGREAVLRKSSPVSAPPLISDSSSVEGGAGDLHAPTSDEGDKSAPIDRSTAKKENRVDTEETMFPVNRISSSSGGPYSGSRAALRRNSSVSAPPLTPVSSSVGGGAEELDAPISNEVKNGPSIDRFIAEKENRVDAVETTLPERRLTVFKEKWLPARRGFVSDFYTGILRVVVLFFSIIMAPYFTDYGQDNPASRDPQF